MSEPVCIFNPEHDLCLGNGDANYVPPRSALRFAADCAAIMRHIYADTIVCCTAADIKAHLPLSSHPIVAWGWNATLKRTLLKQGVRHETLPSDEAIAHIAHLQHRATLLPLLTDARAVSSSQQAAEYLKEHPNAVFKAPWSGSGRGLRWVCRSLSAQDATWIDKIAVEQHCVLAEPRRTVLADFALEYRIANAQLLFVGYSLFATQNGVYRYNLLWSDSHIEAHLNSLVQAQRLATLRTQVEQWLTNNAIPYYQGPLGVDYYIDEQGTPYISEINFRHTMGFVAHELLAHNSHYEDKRFGIAYDTTTGGYHTCIE